MSCTELIHMLDKFNSITQNPVKFLSVQNEEKENIKDLIKSIYDYTKVQESDGGNNKTGALTELIVEDFDEEQIWQELELQNNDCWDQLVADVAKCVSIKDNLKFPIKILEEKHEEDLEETINNESMDEENKLSNIDSDDPKSRTKKKKNNKEKLKSKSTKSSIVDDDFFKLNEMEQFLLQEERKENTSKKVESGSDEESINMFEDDEEEDMEEDGEENNVMYSDFFEGQNGDLGENVDRDDYNESEEEMVSNNEMTTKNKKKVRFSKVEKDSSSDDESDPEVENDNLIAEPKTTEQQSEFEKRQSRLKQQIAKLENKHLDEAPWQMKGQVDASKRPQNSLLEEIVDFDLTSRPPPIITEQTTVTLEDIIKRRIKDKVWDDVVKKDKPIDDSLTYRKPEILDHSKSKMSLAQVYEAEYLKQKHGTEEEDSKEPENHKQIREAMNTLFAKLDALSHYHYTPKAAQAEVKIVSNTPAINMEEVAPVATSNAALLAPEEVKKKNKGELISKEERTATDKKRERRLKKKLQREKGKVEKKEAVKFKKGAEGKDSKSLKTSKAFFEHLNTDVNSLIKPGKFVKRKNK